MVQVKGLVWVGVRTEAFDEMVEFVCDGLGIPTVRLVADQEIGFLPNGDVFEVFAPDYPGSAHFTTGPVVGFLVDDVAAARAELEGRGIEFLGPVGDDGAGTVWSHFRAPDGNIYELTSRES